MQEPEEETEAEEDDEGGVWSSTNGAPMSNACSPALPLERAAAVSRRSSTVTCAPPAPACLLVHVWCTRCFPSLRGLESISCHSENDTMGGVRRPW